MKDGWNGDEQMTKRFRPMLCQTATELPKEKEKWYAERKYDGVRAYIDVQEQKIYDRRGNEITERFPEIREALEELLEKWRQFYSLALISDSSSYSPLMDGEICAEDETFETANARMHLKDKMMQKLAARTNKCVFMVWTMMVNEKGGWKEIRDWLIRRVAAVESDVIRVVPRYTNLEEAWRIAQEKGWEGIVLKRYSSIYECGKRSPLWKKLKCFKEIKHTFTKYEEHPRGITIEDAKGRRVNINGKEAKEIKDDIDTKGKVVVHVQYLPQKNSDAWRFPSFRGKA